MTSSIIVRTIASERPALLRQIHPLKNGKLDVSSFTVGSKEKVWWQCPADSNHEWQASIRSRTRRIRPTGCPYCTNRLLRPDASLSYRFPDLALEWHPTLNGNIRPDKILAGTAKKAWWRCSLVELHEWQASVVNRIRGRGCPYCAGRRVDESNSLATTDPELAKEWHPKKNGSFRPDNLTRSANRRIWWRCSKNARHEWDAVLASRAAGASCPFCAGRKACDDNNLAALFPEIAAEWHPKHNYKLKPKNIPAGSHERAWWQCKVSSFHVWHQEVVIRTSMGTGCPFCSGKKVAEDTSLKAKHPQIAKQWHPSRNKSLAPSDVSPGSHKVAWWRCSRSAIHVWQAEVKSIVRAWNQYKTNGCPFCSGKRICADNNLAALYPLVAQQWHKELNGELSPKEITPYNNSKFWWQCSEGHEWQATAYHIIRSREEYLTTGCPKCALLDRAKARTPDLKKRLNADKRIARENFNRQEVDDRARRIDPTRTRQKKK